MSNIILKDQVIRYVQVEHTCIDSKTRMRAEYIENPTQIYEAIFEWGGHVRFCPKCGEKLPWYPKEVE